jgi:hypothetical protein
MPIKISATGRKVKGNKAFLGQAIKRIYKHSIDYLIFIGKNSLKIFFFFKLPLS